MLRSVLVAVAVLALPACGAEPSSVPRGATLDALEQACLREVVQRSENPRTPPADANPSATCSCMRDRIGDQFSDDAELQIVAALERTRAEMAAMRIEDFQTAERLRRQYNATLDRLPDRSRGRVVSTALQETLALCRAPGAAANQ